MIRAMTMPRAVSLTFVDNVFEAVDAGGYETTGIIQHNAKIQEFEVKNLPAVSCGVNFLL